MPQAQPRYVELPNGSYLEWPEGVSAEEFKAKASRIGAAPAGVTRPDTAVDKMFPTGGTVGVPHPRTGLAGAEDALGNARTRISQFAQKGIGQGAGDFMMSLPLGLLKMAKGGTEIPQGDIWRGTKDVVGGGLEAATIPSGFMAPSSAPKKAATMGMEEATRALTNAVNPMEHMGKFEGMLGEQLGKVVSLAKQKGMPLDSLESLAKAMKSAGDSIKTHYYEKILGPFRDLPVDITAIRGYSGEVAGSPSSATLGQLDARLTQINAEMYSRYAKGGEAASRAAVKSVPELNAEAAYIRKILYDRLGQSSGLGAEEIAKTRKAFGSLEKLSETAGTSAETARHSANKLAQEPLSVNPMTSNKRFVADKVIQKLQGNPTSKAIREAMSRVEVEPYELPEPHPTAAPKVVRSAPLRAGSTAVGSSETSAAEIAEHLKRFKDREAQVLASRNKTLRRPLWEKLGNEPLP